ncbi:MAG: universal stress protein [Planctomycetota bacterium]
MQTPKTIVVPTDFSDLAKFAFPHARALAEAFGAEIVLTHSVPPESYPAYQVVKMTGFPNIKTEVQNAATAELESYKAEFAGLQVSTEFREGRPYACVNGVATDREAGLIVIATHGRGGLTHALLGSTAERVVRTAPVPVLSVHTEGTREPLDPRQVKRVLVPTDFSDTSRAALKVANWFAGTDAEIIAVHAFEPPSFPAGPFGILAVDMGALEAELRAKATEGMEAWMVELRKVHANARGLMPDGDPVEAVVQVAADENADLIIVGTHGHTGLKHLYLGSVAEDIVRRAACPVLTLRG